MQSRGRTFLAMLALWSLLTTFVPAFAWACPLTGRISSTPELCVAAKPAKATPKDTPLACCPQTQSAPSLQATACCHLVWTARALPNATRLWAFKANHSAADGSEACRPATPFHAPHSARQMSLARYASGTSPPPPEIALCRHSGRAPPVV